MTRNTLPALPSGTDDADRRWLALAVDLAGKCPPSLTAFSVGAIVTDQDGNEISRGHSRQRDPHDHAEEVALAEIPPGASGLTLYTSLEPCSRRSSRSRTCTQLVLGSGVNRVVIAWREPDLFVADCQGAELLSGAGLEVVEIPSLAGAARQPNAHLFPRPADG